ncbi:MAG: hypothetical protein OHK0048_18420 [Rhodoferax sp.]
MSGQQAQQVCAIASDPAEPSGAAPVVLPVLVPTPTHSALGSVLSYTHPQPLPTGTLVRVPLGRRECLGLVWPDAAPDAAPVPPERLRGISTVLSDLPPLAPQWLDLVRFAAQYYQRSPGEVALAALPPQLRALSAQALARYLRPNRPAQRSDALPDASAAPPPAELSPEQALALAQIETQSGPFLLHGVTGSGKTEVYMRCAAQVLSRDPHAQVLVMVPEINLTPQLEARFGARFGSPGSVAAVVALHSGMTPAQRLKAWLAAHRGQARVILGTRLSVLASIPNLALIIVDEEHDPSYKSQEGARYSARDLAVYRGHLCGAKVVLGSATPSLESWHRSRPGGRYQRLSMTQRIGADGQGQAGLPTVRRVDMRHQPRGSVLAPAVLSAVAERVARGQQSLLLLNRRGYAPVLHCGDCGWKSQCPHCSAYRVFHKTDHTLRCHHCGASQRVPQRCPDCGNPDIAPIGRGTERLQEQVQALLADVRRPDGTPARVLRIDADSTRAQGALAQQLAQVHDGQIDVLVGTQIVAKGHDFRRITLVVAVNPDGALFSTDFRAPERLFALLMQASGRAGRDTQCGQASEVWIQTEQPGHPLYAALARHDYAAFAAAQLAERESAGLPPFRFQALVRAEARTQEAAQAFLNQASAACTQQADLAPWLDAVTRYPAVPMGVQRVARVERAQMLLESGSRRALQGFLAAWQPVLHATRGHPACRGLLRWAIDVDPLQI